MTEGRQAATLFENIDGKTKVTIAFDAVNENPVECKKTDGRQSRKTSASASTGEKVSETVQFLRNHHVEPMPDNTSKVKVREEDDRWVLESAVRATADILVTGDKDLLDISDQVPQLRIVTPRMFWELIQE